ncbi:MAG: bacterial Ig-like domain-containing protein [Clostridiales bacterium]|nr:bacterial Ig-like domain-containing protein [Clostridiales bacterium]
MKKILVILLSLLFALSCVLLVACNATVTELSIVGAPSQVKRGETIDYSKINLVVTYDDGNTETLALTDKNSGVNYTAIDTSTTGAKALSARYRGKSAQVTIAVVEGDVSVDDAVVNKYANTDGYNAYIEAIKEQSNKQTEFYNRNVGYTVGNVNGYRLLPVVTAIVDGKQVTLDEVDTTYKISLKEGNNWTELTGDSLKTYLSNVENNIYYFTAAAENQVFKLEVTLGEEYNVLVATMSKTITQEFTVVEGYNAYDVLGLSVIDNCNIKAWAGKKDFTFAWDNGKKVSEFSGVKQVILHNNINIKAGDLPESYFWKEGDGGSVSFSDAKSRSPEDLRPYLAGSLKEVYLGEDWEGGANAHQRGLFVSSGIGLNGNFLKVEYENNINTKGENGLYVVYDFNQKSSEKIRSYPESHYSIICYRAAGQQEGLNDVPVIENVYFAGETSKTEDITTPAGLMAVSSDLDEFTISNTIASYWFSNLTFSGKGSVNTIDSCKFYDSFSQMVYSLNLAEINVTNSEMKGAGGPLFIMIETDDVDTQLNIDSTDNMESWVTGSEVWFTINMEGAASVVPQLLSIATLSDSVVGTHYAATRKGTNESGQEVELPAANLIAVVIPSPGDVFTNQKAIQGTITVGKGDDVTSYGMRDSVFATMVDLANIAATGADLGTRTSQAFKALDPNADTAALDALQAGFAQMAAMPELQALKIAPVYQCGNAYAMSTTGANFLSLSQGGVVSDNLSALYGGVLQAIATMEAIPQAAELLTEWQALKTRLQPLGELQVDAETWSTSFTAGHLAFWVNPGGLDAQHPDLTLKHFMILLGEGKAVAKD